MRYKSHTFMDMLEYYFNTYLPVAKGLSDKTIASYKATFRLLFEFLYTAKGIPSDKVSFEAIDNRVIEDFLAWLENDRGCSVTTRNQRLSALAAFSMYAQNRDFDAACAFRNNILKVPRKRGTRNGRSTFTKDEVKILFELPDSRREIGLRDKTLLCFMYASGMRAQEVCEMAVGDIRFYPDRAGINVHGKGNKIRQIGIPAAASEMLKAYIKHRGLSDRYDRHVFSSQTHEKMTVSCIEEIFAKYIGIAKQDHPDLFRCSYTPHSMRHTTATHMLEAGVPLIVVKNFLGHVSLQTTQIYTEVTQDTMNRQLKAWNDKWFLKHEQADNEKSNTPGFLR
jgi:integrase/recombinase XerD